MYLRTGGSALTRLWDDPRVTVANNEHPLVEKFERLDSDIKIHVGTTPGQFFGGIDTGVLPGGSRAASTVPWS